MGSFKDELIAEQDRKRAEERSAEHSAKGLRDDNPTEHDAFDYLYDTNQLHLLDVYPGTPIGQIADMALREANARPPEPESFKVFAADQ